MLPLASRRLAVSHKLYASLKASAVPLCPPRPAQGRRETPLMLIGRHGRTPVLMVTGWFATRPLAPSLASPATRGRAQQAKAGVRVLTGNG